MWNLNSTFGPPTQIRCLPGSNRGLNSGAHNRDVEPPLLEPRWQLNHVPDPDSTHPVLNSSDERRRSNPCSTVNFIQPRPFLGLFQLRPSLVSLRSIISLWIYIPHSLQLEYRPIQYPYTIPTLLQFPRPPLTRPALDGLNPSIFHQIPTMLISSSAVGHTAQIRVLFCLLDVPEFSLGVPDSRVRVVSRVPPFSYFPVLGGSKLNKGSIFNMKAEIQRFTLYYCGSHTLLHSSSFNTHVHVPATSVNSIYNFAPNVSSFPKSRRVSCPTPDPYYSFIGTPHIPVAATLAMWNHFNHRPIRQIRRNSGQPSFLRVTYMSESPAAPDFKLMPVYSTEQATKQARKSSEVNSSRFNPQVPAGGTYFSFVYPERARDRMRDLGESSGLSASKYIPRKFQSRPTPRPTASSHPTSELPGLQQLEYEHFPHSHCTTSTRTGVENCALEALLPVSRSPATLLKFKHTGTRTGWICVGVEQAHHTALAEDGGGRNGDKDDENWRWFSFRLIFGKENNQRTKAASTSRPETYTRTRYRRIERALDSSAVIWVWDWDQGRVAADADVLMRGRRHGVKGKRERQAKYSIIYRDGTRKAEEVRLGFWEGWEAEGLWEKQKRAVGGRREEGEWASTRRVGREACARGREGGREEGLKEHQRRRRRRLCFTCALVRPIQARSRTFKRVQEICRKSDVADARARREREHLSSRRRQRHGARMGWYTRLRGVLGALHGKPFRTCTKIRSRKKAVLRQDVAGWM
ncbi:hypothetical protein B0H16DRAFT_1473200 [Mycena metata]|uniref:Uncharacterized protein n=1 Tax=Mycena metata TaxID=1033252 RepID=A0AAD7HKA2_9AGAR|nr:hypothetical protein B0H16DRAFT_1473200 [Mycena metata]